LFTTTNAVRSAMSASSTVTVILLSESGSSSTILSKGS